jgi:hypothetical protein
VPPNPTQAFASYDQYGIYASSGTMDPQQGSISVWLKFLVGQSRRDHMVVHADDSRWVLYIDTFYASGLGRDILSIAARAGGDQQATSGNHSGFPEARLWIDNDGSLRDSGYGAGKPWIGMASFPEGEWHHIGMTWQGYPDGVVKLYLDGNFVSQLNYNSNYDGGGPMFRMFSYGFKPYSWPAPGALPQYGDSGTGRLESGGIVATGLILYPAALRESEIGQLAAAGPN